MHLLQRLLVIAAIVLLGACEAERPVASSGQRATSSAPSGAGTALLELTPRDPTARSVIRVVAKGFDLSQAEIQWLLNGSPVTTEIPGKFDCSVAAKGSTVQAVARVQGQEILSDPVEIRNTRPELVNVRFLPETFRPGDTLMVEAEAKDIDGDPVTILYAWKRNDAPAGNTSTIAGTVMRGDRVTVSITPFDGEHYGTPVVLNTEIRNLPPSFVEHKNFTFTGGRYLYQARATDPDGDVLAYSLSDAPEGMIIDRSTGELSWNVPPDFSGQSSATIVAEDGHGGTARYSIVISISP
jgi:hypothetical protein